MEIITMPLPTPVALDPFYADRLSPFESIHDIPPEWINTPIEKLIRAQNFQEPITPTGRPELLIASCIEFRYALPIPSMYAYVIRRASGRLVGSEFSLAYVLAKGVSHIVLVGHNDCGMAQVFKHQEVMANALVKQGWHPDRAREFIDYQSARYSIGDEILALEKEYFRLHRLFHQVTIAPLFACLHDQHYYLPNWYHEAREKVARARSAPESTVHDEDLLSLF